MIVWIIGIIIILGALGRGSKSEILIRLTIRILLIGQLIEDEDAKMRVDGAQVLYLVEIPSSQLDRGDVEHSEGMVELERVEQGIQRNAGSVEQNTREIQ